MISSGITSLGIHDRGQFVSKVSSVLNQIESQNSPIVCSAIRLSPSTACRSIPVKELIKANSSMAFTSLIDWRKSKSGVDFEGTLCSHTDNCQLVPFSMTRKNKWVFSKVNIFSVQ
jgi:hypothetical protein